ncbi:vacuolar protein-sorting-associated protein 28 [Zygosaccharomyces mellis]|uniref:Vacuolar protein sorting-associated protein 28 n=1 Tax=Zygosaccharomyces mellis TaxID=42258 RepID=A0A4C2E416_9SACH|nr:vacuolar protein-sorting-associated protein 28 [Zygosaccharomyces mellis]
MQLIPLFEPGVSIRQREVTEALAELYSIIICVDQVEKMYLKDVILDESEYNRVTTRLLQQYRAIMTNNDEDHDFQTAFGGSLQEFCKKYGVIASNGVLRLEKGIPLTTEHAATDGNVKSGNTLQNSQSASASATDRDGVTTTGENLARGIAEATGNFITVMDAVKLGYRTRDQLHPLLAELLLSTNRVARLESKSRGRLVEWLVHVNRLRGQESIDEKAARKLLEDLDTAYREFYSALG